MYSSLSYYNIIYYKINDQLTRDPIFSPIILELRYYTNIIL